MFDREAFERSKREWAEAQGADDNLCRIARDFLIESDKYRYGYQWTWLGLPIIQMPQDILATQEIIWQNKPDVIIETGVAWGGSLVFYASLMELIGDGKVVGVDRLLPKDENLREMMKFPFSRRITLLEGSSVDPQIVVAVRAHIKSGHKVMVLLDSNHTHTHVLEELRLYGPLVTTGQYLVVSDTIVEDIPRQVHRSRPWGPGNNPKTALRAYLEETDRFEVDRYVNGKLLTTYSPGGYLVCVK